MNLLKSLGLAGALSAAALSCPSALAQSTDGYHTIQILPLVVDNNSFTQRYQFRNPNPVAINIAARFYPDRAFNLGPVQCNSVNVPANSTVSVDRLTSICAIPGGFGTNFGYLYTSETSGANLVYAVHARTVNPSGIGFSVEGFPAHTFTSAAGVVTGLQRKSSFPAFSSNCFVGNLNDVNTTAVRPSTQVLVTLRDSGGNVLGNTITITLNPGQVERQLEIFNKVGAPLGDHIDVTATFEEMGDGEPAILAFCTVQENTTTGADFRIAKQEWGNGGQANPGDTIGAQDNHVTRNTLVDVDSVGRTFTIPGATQSANTHVMYFRHPDYVQCEITDPAGNRLPASYNLEMRLLDPDGQLIAGGDGQTGFGEIYLGNKTDRNLGSNTRYRIEVEDGDLAGPAVRSYRLHCQSGSGHTLGDIIRYQEAIDRF